MDFISYKMTKQVADEKFPPKKSDKDFIKNYAKVWFTLSIVSVLVAFTFMVLFIVEDQV